MTLFIIAGVVALLGSFLNVIVAMRYRAAYKKRLDSLLESSQLTLGYGLNPSVIGNWFERVADVSANFPAVILTLVAFMDREPFATSTLLLGGLLVLAAAFAVGVLTFDTPTRTTWSLVIFRSKKRNVRVSLSLWTLILVSLNALGVILSL